MQNLVVNIENVLLLQTACCPFSLNQVLGLAGYTVLPLQLADPQLAKKIRGVLYDMVVVETDELSGDLLNRLTDTFPSHQQHIVVFSRSVDKHLMLRAFQKGVIAHALDAATVIQVRSLIDLASYFFLSHDKLESELSSLQQAQADHRHVEEAKYLLMEQKGMTEQAAYALLRSSAMDCGQRIVDISRALVAQLKRHPLDGGADSRH